jgi:hypothetical protein
MSMWDLGNVFTAARKETVTAEYLGRRLADEVWRDVRSPKDPLPTTYVAWEWLIIRAFVASRAVHALLERNVVDRNVVDRTVRAMQARLCHPAHFKTRHALTAFRAVAELRYQEYLNAFDVWRTQKDDDQLTRALASHALTENADSKEVLDLFSRFAACLRKHNEGLRINLHFKFNVR